MHYNDTNVLQNLPMCRKIHHRIYKCTLQCTSIQDDVIPSMWQYYQFFTNKLISHIYFIWNKSTSSNLSTSHTKKYAKRTSRRPSMGRLKISDREYYNNWQAPISADKLRSLCQVPGAFLHIFFSSPCLTERDDHSQQRTMPLAIKSTLTPAPMDLQSLFSTTLCSK